MNRTTSLAFAIILLMMASWIACNKKSTVEPKGPASVTGTLQLPGEASGKKWGVLIDDDLNGDNGFIRADSGTCGSGTTVKYTIDDVAAGTYYIYAVVFVASDGRKGPQGGDYLGIYGGSFPDDVPGAPNAVVPSSGTATFNINLMLVAKGVKSGNWTGTSGFGEFDMVVNSDGTLITKFVIKFSDWVCGGIRHGGSLTLTYRQSTGTTLVPFNFLLVTFLPNNFMQTN